MTKTPEIRLKEIIFYSKIIFTFLIIGFLITLNYIDLKENVQNASYLSFLKDVGKGGLDRYRFENFEKERNTLLIDINPGLRVKHMAVRKTMEMMLNDNGADIDADTKGGSRAKRTENRFMLMFPSTAVEKQINELLQYENRKKKYNKEDHQISTTVTDAFKRFDVLSKPNETAVVVWFDSNMLRRKIDSATIQYLAFEKKRELEKQQKKIDSDAEETEGGYERKVNAVYQSGARIVGKKVSGKNNNTKKVKSMDDEEDEEDEKDEVQLFNRYSFSRLEIKDSLIIIHLGDDLDVNQDNTTSDKHFNFSIIEIPAKTENHTFPSVLQLAGFDSSFMDVLIKKQDIQNEVKNLYGNYSIDQIEDLQRNVLNKNTDAISILGFDVSRKWFPLALSIVLGLLYYLLIKAVKSAHNEKQKIISGISSDDMLAGLAQNNIIRFFLWCLAPALLIASILSTSLIVYSYLIYAIIFCSTIFSTFCGIAAYNFSRKL